jgi:hypothetical protein
MPTGRRRLLVSLLLAGLLLAGAARVAQVRFEYGEWGIGPSASPPQLFTGGREYRRSALPLSAPRPGEVVVGHAAGGDLYGAPGARYDRTAVVLVRGATVTEYGLVGGP